MLTPADLRFFDPHDEYLVTWNRLPHWSQAGTMTFLTYRTNDSMPARVIREFVHDRSRLLREHGIDPAGDWQSALAALPPANRLRIKWQLSEKFDGRLDRCAGACCLRRRSLATIVEESLKAFDGDRYLLTDLVVMPNHVHLLAAFESADKLEPQMAAWKRFQARRINAAINSSGHFWHAGDFDHLVRNEHQFEYYRKYIADNGVKANLCSSDYLHWSRPMSSDFSKVGRNAGKLLRAQFRRTGPRETLKLR